MIYANGEDLNKAFENFDECDHRRLLKPSDLLVEISSMHKPILHREFSRGWLACEAYYQEKLKNMSEIFEKKESENNV